ncbi:MAG: tetratricopeptide repeat protein [Cyanobacterium sp. T60_A2020_053]|nr:tetratricopeptide repeat protein [Cyanobacterium sp. T60_A2020_053]
MKKKGKQKKGFSNSTSINNSSQVSDTFNQQLQTAIDALQNGQLAESKCIFEQLLKINSKHPDVLHLLGIIYAQQKDFKSAELHVTKAIECQPNQAIFYKNLANVYQDQNNLSKAIEFYQKTIELAPQWWEVYQNLGVLLGLQNELDLSIKYLEIFTQNNSKNPTGYNDLGVVYGKQKHHQKAIECFQKSLTINSQQPLTLINLANAYLEIENFILAEETSGRALELNPHSADAYYHLGLALQKQDKLTEAVSAYHQAINIKANYPEALNNLGNILSKQGKFNQAIEYYRRALDFEPTRKETHFALGNILLSQGKTEEVLQSYQQAFTIDPEFLYARSNYIFSLNYSPEYTPEYIYQQHQKWSELYEIPLYNKNSTYTNHPQADKKIRLGYVSGDFRHHSVAFFIEEIFINYNREQFEVFCYYNNEKEDDTTIRLRSLVDGWRDIHELEDEEVYQQIQKDEIDILIDLSGHTSAHRLLLFSRKPAPIQVNYIGYPNTTGLKSIDYRIVDNYTDPKGKTEHLHSENLIRLPHFLCYHPPDNSPPVSELPALQNKYITFGSFNNFAKINPPLIQYWSKILNNVENSRLILKTNYHIDKETHQYWLEIFKENGINAERVRLVSKIPDNQNHLAYYENIDIALDTYPYHGTTTTCEALWMQGVFILKNVSFSN